ncbi:hypothetical protein L2X99_13985 [Microbacterium sp. KUDC0406]|uniref:4'-phosphopantetheinyl transferase family protein n=1 Tax=Microbacterium sp. KUDC0406 TaxID=2909588 RepID=UPI001F34E142|nr:hypothetical protein [Microbacterium sp. KUDC0406]UJP09521.1 hypothetical protein L2X99_13985 [Microbacterium sp. KUDC0406]
MQRSGDDGLGRLLHTVHAADRGNLPAVALWHITVAPLTGVQMDEAVRRGWLTRSERLVAERRSSDMLRGAFGSRRVLRRLAASVVLRCAPEVVEIASWCPRCGIADHGRPWITNTAGRRLSMSTSSSGDTVVIAIGARSIGIDIESEHRVADPALVAAARRLDGWDEVALACPSDSTPLMEWTAFEAIAKTTGHGLTAGQWRIAEALAQHRLEWFTDRHGWVTCVAAAAPAAPIL